MVAEFFGFVGEVVGVYADTVPAHKPGSKPEGVPFGVHTVDHLVGVDPHAVENHGEFVHKGDIYIALAVFDHLDRFGGFDVGHREGANLDNYVVHVLNLLQGFFITARYNLVYIFKAVNLVTRVYAFGRVADFEIFTANKSRFFFEDGYTNVFGATRVYG